ncbi:hypothetical protein [Actinoplanes sp. NPDC026623]|uniref:hypothetical protein n=1 Tax=Actinoplanes sp. NPDC026623 TaxID=3155610 RepID=UPI0033F65BB6
MVIVLGAAADDPGNVTALGRLRTVEKSVAAIGFAPVAVPLAVAKVKSPGDAPVYLTVKVTLLPSQAWASLIVRLLTEDGLSAKAGAGTMTAGTRPMALATAALRTILADLCPRSENGSEPLLAAWAG